MAQIHSHPGTGVEHSSYDDRMQQELVAKLEAAGYSQLGESKSTAEGTVAKAAKDGKEVTLIVDSSGQIKERR